MIQSIAISGALFALIKLRTSDISQGMILTHQLHNTMCICLKHLFSPNVAAILYQATSDCSYVDPCKVEDILGVSKQQIQESSVSTTRDQNPGEFLPDDLPLGIFFYQNSA